MVKKVGILGLGLGLVGLSGVLSAIAQEQAATGPEVSATGDSSASGPMDTPATSQDEPSFSKEAEAAAQLNGTEWNIELNPMYGEPPGRSLKDTLEFSNGKIISTRMNKEGFPTSNYTITVGDDGVAVWETMQTSETEGVAFWRGELHGDSMRGILSQHPLEGTTVDYSFTSQSMRKAAAPLPGPSKDSVSAPPQTLPSQEASSPPASEGGTPEEDTTPPKPKKARKGWFGFGR